jgi:hypothetical protein
MPPLVVVCVVVVVVVGDVFTAGEEVVLVEEAGIESSPAHPARPNNPTAARDERVNVIWASRRPLVVFMLPIKGQWPCHEIPFSIKRPFAMT